jgi:hypothetical protein
MRQAIEDVRAQRSGLKGPNILLGSKAEVHLVALELPFDE